MAGYTIRSLGQLAAEATGAFVQAVQGTATKLWPNVWRVESKVLALVGFEMEQRRAWLVRQLFASTADRLWLIRHGFELNLQPFPAQASSGTATFPATPGLVVPAGLQFARGDGAAFTSLASATALGASVTLPVEADTAGASGNCDGGTALTLVNVDDAPAGFGGTGAVDAASDGSGLAGGADAEETEAFRARVLARKRRAAQGGNTGDWEEWVREALGSVVDRVFVDSFQNDARAVWVAFTVTDQPSGIPTAAQIAIVQAYISDPVRRPVQARAFAVPLTPVPVPVAISELTPDTPAIRASIAAELAAVFADRARPGTPSEPFVLSRSWLNEAVSRATGEDSHDLDLPVGDPVFTAGQMPVYAAPTYS